jgi:biopolymer transport protein ExbD
MAASIRQEQGPKGDINVTPLVDVVLVLLIIFMVITPMLQKGAQVELPVTEHPKKAESVKEQVTVSVDAQGLLYLETNLITDQELVAQMAEFYRTTPTRPIFIKGDVKSNYGRIRRVMKLINDAGFQAVGIITKEPET